MDVVISWQRSGDARSSGSGELAASPPRRVRIGRAADCDIILDDETVSRYHAAIEIAAGGVTASDLGSGNGTMLDGHRIDSARWPSGATLAIGPFELRLVAATAASILLPDDNAVPTEDPFPGNLFASLTVSVPAIKSSGKLAAEVTYLAIGGGLGSFVWVDHLRVFGVPAAAIRVLGVAQDRKPYAKYARLCRNSQIPDHERIRSNSISAPDNIWGFPGYAIRECWSELNKGNPGGVKYIWQVFAEPALAVSYTPRAGDVYASLDAEAKRIGWNGMWIDGNVVKVRKTDDDRYVVAYRVPRHAAREGDREQFIIARHLHIATGYPASNFLADLQDFRSSNPGASTMVVNAYEEHEGLYQQLAVRGGTALVRGRGIVASRVIQRLYEERRRNRDIRVVHLMRSPVDKGSQFGLARRAVHDNVEHQPFNWPKACWGGSLRKAIEQASPDERQKYFRALGGTTTAFRSDWRALIADGLASSWYTQVFGGVKAMRLQGSRVVSEIDTASGAVPPVEADFVIDCTGLVGKLDANPVLKDLTDTYALPRNSVSGDGIEQRLAGLTVSNSFEIEGLKNGRGSVHAAGVVTANGPYAAVDSFLGLQYAALRSVDNLQAGGAPGLTGMGPLRSLRQWLRWCRGAAP